MNGSVAQHEQFTILCVEDEEHLRRDISEELIEAGYSVIEAHNGESALQRLHQVRPDLILCDISMPGINGYEVLRRVHAKGADYLDIPFVFLSALAESHQIVRGKTLGADDYLIKPIDYDLMLATVAARLRQVQRIRSARHADDIETHIHLYGFTPTEARVATELTRGKTLAQIASGFGVSRTTIAFHMRNIFQKTGATRQAELVMLLLQKPASSVTPVSEN